MIFLQTLTLNNFRSFEGCHTLEFDENGLVLLTGNSGSGKSSVFLAIAYALDFCPFSAKDLRSWGADEPMWVELTLSTPEGPLTVRRGDKNCIHYQGQKITSAKGIAGTLDKVLNLNKPLREALTYRAQRQPGVFLTKTDGEKKQFLTDVLDLGWLEWEIDESVKRVCVAQKALEEIRPLLDKASSDANFTFQYQIDVVLIDQYAIKDELSEAEQALEVAQAQIMDEAQRIAEAEHEAETTLARELRAIDEEKITMFSAWQPLVIELVDHYAEIREKNKKDFEEAERIRLELEGQDLKAQKEIESKKNALQQDLYSFHEKLNEVDKAKERKPQLEKAIVSLQGQKCPECKQDWNKSIERLKQYQSDLDMVTQVIQTEGGWLRSIEDLETRKKQLQYVRNPELDEITGILNELSKSLLTEELRVKSEQAAQEAKKTERLLIIDNKITTRKLKHQEALNEIKRDPGWLALLEKERDLKTKVQRLLGELSTIEATNQARRQESANNQRMRDRALGYLAEIQGKIAICEKAYALERDWLEMLRGFLGQIFSEVLTAIETEANRQMGCIPNIANVSLRFSVERTTQDGRIRSEITPIISYGSQEAPLLSGASGGMLSSIEMAVDLAVSKVVAERLGVCLGWTVFDEPMTGLDTASQEAALELLKEEARTKLIMVVTHGSEMRENFSKIIEIKNENGKSSLTTL